MIILRQAVFCFAMASLVLGAVPTTTAAPKQGLPSRAYALRSEKLSIINEETFEALDTLALPEGKTVFWWNNAEQDRLALIIQDGHDPRRPAVHHAGDRLGNAWQREGRRHVDPTPSP